MRHSSPSQVRLTAEDRAQELGQGEHVLPVYHGREDVLTRPIRCTGARVSGGSSGEKYRVLHE